MPVWKKIIIILLVSAVPVSIYMALSSNQRSLPLADFLFLLGLMPWIVAFGLSIHQRKVRINPEKQLEATEDDAERSQDVWLSARLAVLAGSIPVALSFVVSYWPR